MGILTDLQTAIFKIIFWNFELDSDFPWKKASDKLPGQFSRKSWFHKNQKREGAALNIFFQNPYFAHNSAPVGAEVCEIKTTPPESESIIF